MTPLVNLLKEARKDAARTAGSMPRADVLQALYDTRYTGRIVMDFKDGQIATVNIPSDVKIRVE